MQEIGESQMLVLSNRKLLFLSKQFMLERVVLLITNNGMNALLFTEDIGKLETGTITIFFLNHITFKEQYIT